MNSKERLKVYIDSDTSYQDYLNGKDGFSDAEMVNIEHCKDIEEILEENAMLNAINESHHKLNSDLIKEIEVLNGNKD